MLIGAGLYQVINLLRVSAIVSPVAELAAMSAELVAQFSLLRCHVRPRFMMMNGVLVREHLAGTIYCDGPCLSNGVLQESAMVSVQARHSVLLLNLHWATRKGTEDLRPLPGEPRVHIGLGFEHALLDGDELDLGLKQLRRQLQRLGDSCRDGL